MREVLPDLAARGGPIEAADPRPDGTMKIDCENARPLLSSYLDGELSEAQAAPVRAHLLDCLACRESVQEGSVIRRWFEGAREEVEVPEGFSARVARRAFAGDPGLLEPVAPPERSASLLPFVLKLSVVAAVALFAFSLMIQRLTLPSGDDLQASDRSWMFEPPPAALPAAVEAPAAQDDTPEQSVDEDEPGTRDPR